MTLKTFCKPRQSVFAADRRATVLNLDTFLNGAVNGEDFFEENYFTNGMLTLGDSLRKRNLKHAKPQSRPAIRIMRTWKPESSDTALELTRPGSWPRHVAVCR